MLGRVVGCRFARLPVWPPSDAHAVAALVLLAGAAVAGIVAADLLAVRLRGRYRRLVAAVLAQDLLPPRGGAHGLRSCGADRHRHGQRRRRLLRERDVVDSVRDGMPDVA